MPSRVHRSSSTHFLLYRQILSKQLVHLYEMSRGHDIKWRRNLQLPNGILFFLWQMPKVRRQWMLKVLIQKHMWVVRLIGWVLPGRVSLYRNNHLRLYSSPVRWGGAHLSGKVKLLRECGQLKDVGNHLHYRGAQLYSANPSSSCGDIVDFQSR